MQDALKSVFRFYATWLLIGLLCFEFMSGWTVSLLPVVLTVAYLYRRVIGFRTSLVDVSVLTAFGILLIAISNALLDQSIVSGNASKLYDYALPEFFHKSHKVLFYGYMAIFLGFDLPENIKLRRVIEFNVSSSRGYGIVVLASIIVSVIPQPVRNFLPGSLNYILTGLPLTSIVYFARLGFGGMYPRGKLYALIITLISSTFSLLFAYLRAEIVIPFFLFIVGALWGKKSLAAFKDLYFVPIYGAVVIFLIVFSILGQVRSSDVYYGVSRLDAIVSARQDQTQIADDAKKSDDSALDRLANLAQVSQVCSLKEQKRVLGGETIGILLTSLVPRVLWPDKPKIALGVWFAYTIGLAVESGDWYNNSINMTVPGHAWLEFGQLGMVVVCMLIGFLIRILWKFSSVENNPNNLGGTILATYLMYSCFSGIGADLQIVVTFISTSISIYLVTRLFSWAYVRS